MAELDVPKSIAQAAPGGRAALNGLPFALRAAG